jgi:hypothetical protein
MLIPSRLMDSMLDHRIELNPSENHYGSQLVESGADAYFSADVETDGPIPGPFSILSFYVQKESLPTAR